MITRQDLEAAIAECSGERNPNANTCLKLASYMTIYDHMYREDNVVGDVTPQHSYSYDDHTINVNGNSEFINSVNSKDIDVVFGIMDELMETLQILNPRLYDSVIQKLIEAG